MPTDFISDYRLAKDPATSREILRTLAASLEVQVRRRVAENLSTTEDIQLLLASDSDVWVLTKLLSNPHLTGEVLDILARSHIDTVRERVAAHKNTSEEILASLSKDESPWVEMKAEKRLLEKQRPSRLVQLLSAAENEVLGVVKGKKNT